MSCAKVRKLGFRWILAGGFLPNPNRVFRAMPRPFALFSWGAFSGLWALLLLLAMARTLPLYALEHSIPWDLAELRKQPRYELKDAGSRTSEVICDVVDGRRIFGYLSRPEGPGPFPALLLISGFKQPARRDWAEHHAARGYVALVFDHLGRGPDGQPLADSVIPVTEENTFEPFTRDVRSCAPFQTIAACLRGISLLDSLEDVDRSKIGVTGLSWGGVLCCIIPALDERIRCAVAVYGCGGISLESGVLAFLNLMSASDHLRWSLYFDPCNYLPWIRCPILLINGTNDPIYPFSIHRQSYLIVPGPKSLSVRINMSHGYIHEWPWWQDSEVFLDAHLKGGTPFPTITQTEFGPSRVAAQIASTSGSIEAYLCWTTSQAYYRDRPWQAKVLPLEGSQISAELPPGTVAYYLAASDIARRAMVTTPFQTGLPTPDVTLTMPPQPSPSGPYTFAFSSTPNRQYEIQGSSDLERWVPLAMIFARDRTTTFADPVGADRPRRFYRTVLVP